MLRYILVCTVVISSKSREFTRHENQRNENQKDSTRERERMGILRRKINNAFNHNKKLFCGTSKNMRQKIKHISKIKKERSQEEDEMMRLWKGGKNILGVTRRKKYN